MSTEPYLSIIIPAYNEEQRIGPTLKRILAYLAQQPWTHEILVVLDGSRDRTADTVRASAGHYPNLRVLDNGVNRGKGFCVSRGMLEARGTLRLFSDADLSTPIECVEPLIASIQNGHDIAIGSRGLSTSDIRVPQPWWRQMMGRIFNRFVQRIALPGIKDTQCGFKLFTERAACAIFPRQRIERFGFDVEVLWIARTLGLRVAEIPVTWVNHPLSKVRPITDASRMFADLIRVRLFDWRGYYGAPLQQTNELPPHPK